jgi:polyvinyl alcohol dehydrogenase (cytochrome)
MDVAGHINAMDAATGQILSSFVSGGSCNAGAAVIDGEVYWGSGYASLAAFVGATENNKFYGFGLQE